MHDSKTYYEGIDGLRAIAVLSVILFHADAAWLPGGFLGVDVFFVISGFVVSVSVANKGDLRLPSFLAYFYARRLLRIAPALVVCLLATALASTLLIPDAWLSDTNNRTGLAAFFGLSNFVLVASSSDYFSPKTEFNPFTHTWSLAIEEQFYLLFPLLYLGWLKAAGMPARRRRWIAAIALLSTGSLVLCWMWNRTAPSQAFYLIQARFWELGAGVLLFMTRSTWQPRMQRLPRPAVHAMLLGAAAVAAVSFATAQSQPLPFPRALPIVLATCAVIALLVSGNGGLGATLLKRPVMALTGKASYSLYLWHWPTFVIFRWTVGMDTLAQQACAIGVAVLLGSLSLRFIERPVRELKSLPRVSRVRVVASGLAMIATTSVATAGLFSSKSNLSLSVTRDSGIWQPTSETPGLARPPGCTLEETSTAFAGGAVKTFRPSGCGAGERQGRMFVGGDSHAWAYTSMLRRFAQDNGMEVRVYTKGGCSLFNLMGTNASASPPCQQFSSAVSGVLATDAHAGDVLFLPSLRVPRLKNQWGEPERSATEVHESPDAIVTEAVQAFKPLAARGVAIIFEAPKPVFEAPPFRCADWFNSGNEVCRPGFSVSRSLIENLRAPVLSSMERIHAEIPALKIWDPFPVLCPKEPCESFQAGKPIFFDGDHLSNFGNMFLYDSFRRFVLQSTPIRDTVALQ